MKRKLIFIFAFLAYLFFQTVYANLNQNIQPLNLNDLQSGKHTLIVGHIADFPPFYTSNSANPKGLDPDIFKAVAKRAGVKNIVFKGFNNFSELNQALNKGEVDVIVNDYWDIPDHRAQALLTKSYYLRDGVAFVYSKKHYQFNSPKDLHGHKIGVFAGSTDVNNWLKRNPIANSTTQVFSSRNELMQALKNNKIAAAFVYYTLYLYVYGKDKDRYPFAVVVIKPIDSAFGVRHQDKALHKKLNEAIDSMWSDGSLYKLKKKHLGPLGIEPAHTH